LWRSKQSLGVKIQGSYHLLNSTVFIAIVISALLSVPMLYIRNASEVWQGLINASTFFIIGYVFLAAFYFSGYSRAYKAKGMSRFVHRMLLLLAMFLGLALHNAWAVMEGWLGKKSAFIRTPKFNALGKSGTWKDNIYSLKKLPGIVALEALMAVYFGFGLVLAFHFQDFALLPFHLLLTVGHVLVLGYSLLHR
jgi:hypothetical protein